MWMFVVERKLGGSWYSSPPARTCVKCAPETFPDTSGKKSVIYLCLYLQWLMLVYGQLAC